MRDAGAALLATLRQAAERLEAADALGAADALAQARGACGTLGAQRLSPEALCEAHALQKRCELAAGRLGDKLREQLDSAGQSRRALSAYRAAP